MSSPAWPGQLRHRSFLVVSLGGSTLVSSTTYSGHPKRRHSAPFLPCCIVLHNTTLLTKRRDRTIGHTRRLLLRCKIIFVFYSSRLPIYRVKLKAAYVDRGVEHGVRVCMNPCHLCVKLYFDTLYEDLGKDIQLCKAVSWSANCKF